MNILKPHVSLNVSSIDRAVAFYEKAFGVTVTKRRPGYAKFDLEAPALNLSMVEAPRTGVNVSHFGVQVASSDDVALAKRRFEAAGLQTATEEDTACCYAVQDKVWVTGPGGEPWEVYTVTGDARPDLEGRTEAELSAVAGDGTCCRPEGSETDARVATSCC